MPPSLPSPVGYMGKREVEKEGLGRWEKKTRWERKVDILEKGGGRGRPHFRFRNYPSLSPPLPPPSPPRGGYSPQLSILGDRGGGRIGRGGGVHIFFIKKSTCTVTRFGKKDAFQSCFSCLEKKCLCCCAPLENLV